jgi:hypothetical protein
VGGYLLGFYFQNARLSDLRTHVDKRIDDMWDLLRAEIRASHAELTLLIERNHSEVMHKIAELYQRLSRVENERRIVG